MNNFRHKYTYNTFKGLYGGKTEEKDKKKEIVQRVKKKNSIFKVKD